jgi:hypothetical protein
MFETKRRKLEYFLSFITGKVKRLKQTGEQIQLKPDLTAAECEIDKEVIDCHNQQISAFRELKLFSD